MDLLKKWGNILDAVGIHERYQKKVSEYCEFHNKDVSLTEDGNFQQTLPVALKTIKRIIELNDGFLNDGLKHIIFLNEETKFEYQTLNVDIEVKEGTDIFGATDAIQKCEVAIAEETAKYFSKDKLKEGEKFLIYKLIQKFNPIEGKGLGLEAWSRFKVYNEVEEDVKFKVKCQLLRL